MLGALVINGRTAVPVLHAPSKRLPDSQARGGARDLGPNIKPEMVRSALQERAFSLPCL